MFVFANLPPLSLYVHVPWCVRKCPYCDFNSHTLRGELPERNYIDALLRDLEQDLPRVWGRRLLSVFIGGGTPSLLSAEAIDRLLAGIRALLPGVPEMEVTLEANPGTVERGRFGEYRAAGVNRLSIGVQSFADDKLQALGRIHSGTEACAAAEQAHAAGFDNFNLDLMFGLPGQDLAQARADLDAAIALVPAHISYYQLTLEPNTAFHRQPPVLPDDDRLWDMQLQGEQALGEAGYAQYEVSAYARPERQCLHNLNYWRYGDYLGIGAGAHAKISDAQRQCITRLWKVRSPQDYLAKVERGAHLGGEQLVVPAEVGLEFMMNALRLTGGFDPRLFQQHTGLTLMAVDRPLREAEARGLIERGAQRIRPTEQGRRFLNDLLGLFV